MSLVIGGVAVGGALATGAATAVGSYAVGQLLSSSSGGGGGGGGGGGNPVSSADPFAGERPQYMAGLNTFMNRPDVNNADPYGAVNAVGTRVYNPAIVPGQTAGGQLMSDMLQPGYQFNSSDPSYAFRFNQGAGALAASGAAKGLLNSGNIATALTDYGQQSASQEFAAQFARAGAQDLSMQRLGQNQFSDNLANASFEANQNQQYFTNLMGLNSQQSTANSNQYTRLAQLSGANIGSPGVAGQLQAQQNAAAAASVHQIIDPITGKLVSAGVNNLASSFGGSAASGLTDAAGSALSIYAGDGAAAGVAAFL